MKLSTVLFSVLLVLFTMAGQATTLNWSTLPPLPEAISGQFAGMQDGAIIVAGGSNFEVSPFQGGEKQWKDKIYLLKPGADAWIEAGTLPANRAYGGSISVAGLYIIGGTDGTRCFDDVMVLRWDGQSDTVSVTPGDERFTLPSPCAFTSATHLDGTVYMAGGQADPKATEALHTLWSFELGQPDKGWQELEPDPVEKGYILPVIAAQSGGIYRISGTELHAKADGTPGRKYLYDAWRYTPGHGWEAVAPIPQAVVAAPHAAMGSAHILVFSGDDGTNVERNEELGDNHPGFSHKVLAYHTITDSWAHLGDIPNATVTTQAVVLDDKIIIPGGEDRPGHRLPVVTVLEFAKREGGLAALDYAAIVIYFAVLVGIGFYFSKREKTTEAYFLGGRKVPWWAVGISLWGTSLSAITYLAVPAQAYATDWTFLWANMTVLVIGPIVIYKFIPKLREFPMQTAYEFLEIRFNVATRVYGSICFCIFQVGRVGIVMLLPSIALSAATGLDVMWCIGVMGVLATIYTMVGGIEAVIWTDVMQAIVLAIGAFIALGIVFYNIDGGMATVMADATTANKFHSINLTWDYRQAANAFWVILVGQAFLNLYPITADQTMVQRYLTTATTKQAQRALWTHVIVSIPTTFIFFGLGTALWVFFRHNPELLDPGLAKNDAILPLFIVEKFPMGLKGIIIAGIFAAAMSSLDSSINSVSSVLVNDYYRRFFPNVNDAMALRMAKILTLVFGLVGTVSAVYAAQINSTSLWEPFMNLLALVGSGLAGIYALGVFTKRTHGIGAFTGAITSAGTLYYLSNADFGIHGFLYGFIGFAVAYIVGYCVSLVIPGGKKIVALN